MDTYKGANFRADRSKGVCSPSRWNITDLWLSVPSLPFPSLFSCRRLQRQESCAIVTMTAQCAVYMDALKIFGTPNYAHGYYSQHFHGLMFGSTLWMFLQNLKSVALPVPEIIPGTPKNVGSPWIRPRFLFSEIFNGLLFGLALYMYPPNLKSVALPVLEIIGVPQKFGQSLDTPTLPFL